MKYYIANRDQVMQWIEIKATTDRGAKMIASKAYGKSAEVGVDDSGMISCAFWRGIDGEWNER